MVKKRVKTRKIRNLDSKKRGRVRPREISLYIDLFGHNYFGCYFLAEEIDTLPLAIKSRVLRALRRSGFKRIETGTVCVYHQYFYPDGLLNVGYLKYHLELLGLRVMVYFD